MSEYEEGKWLWMIQYCEKKRIPPAQSWAWKEAEAAYTKMKELQGGNNEV